MTLIRNMICIFSLVIFSGCLMLPPQQKPQPIGSGPTPIAAGNQPRTVPAAYQTSPTGSAEPTQAEHATAPAGEPAEKAAPVEVSPPKGMPDVLPLIGTADDGEAPTIFKDLARTMVPSEVAAIFPGAEKVSKFGISKVKQKKIPGVDAIEFHFLDGKLYSAVLIFKKALAKPAFKQYLWTVLENKYGANDDEKIPTWANADGSMVQSMLFVDRYQVSYTPPR